MKLFKTLYNKTLNLSKHKKAPHFLACVAFTESSIFPIPPDVMLIPMGLARPNKALQYALITTLFSVLGGILGYGLGFFFSPYVENLLIKAGMLNDFLAVKSWFLHYGIWIVFLAGFSPIPYKLFTIAAGVLHMSFIPFVIASLIGRGGRFFLVAILIHIFGEKVSEKLETHIEKLGWLFCIAAGLIYIAYLTYHH